MIHNTTYLIGTGIACFHILFLQADQGYALVFQDLYLAQCTAQEPQAGLGTLLIYLHGHFVGIGPLCHQLSCSGKTLRRCIRDGAGSARTADGCADRVMP